MKLADLLTYMYVPQVAYILATPPGHPSKGENDDKQHGAIDLEKEVQSNVPPSDPICCFTSDDEEMLHAPTRKAKRPFEEVDLDLKAGEHGSPEDRKRRNSWPASAPNFAYLAYCVRKRERTKL